MKSKVHEPTKSRLRNQNCDAQFRTDMDTNPLFKLDLLALLITLGAGLLIYLIASTL